MKTLIANKKKLYIVIVASLLVVFLFFSYTASNRYYFDMDTAVQQERGGKSATKLATVVTDNGTIYFVISDYNTIQAYNFNTKITDNKTLYRVENKTGIVINDENMQKMNTACNDSQEEIVYGIGEKLAQECSDKSGREATFILFEHQNNQYRLWYIVSSDGLPELPEFIIEGVSFDERVSTDNIMVIVEVLVFLFFVGAILYWKFRALRKR